MSEIAEQYSNNLVDMLHAGMISRGNVITGAVLLENTMNLFLAQHFCQGNGKEIELIETVFATRKYTFDSKRDTMYAILRKEDTPYIVDAKALCVNIQKIAKDRNMFAHWILDNSLESVNIFKKDATLTFLKVENSTEPIPFTIKQTEDLIADISASYHLVSELYDSRRTTPSEVKP